MKSEHHNLKWGILLLGVAGFVLFSGQIALAAENGPGWRPVYDTAMRWLNFIILVAVIVKYGRSPLKHFLQMRKEEIQQEIETLENDKQRLLDKVKAAKKREKAQEHRLKRLKERIIAEGEKTKQRIIEDARQQSVSMMEDAKRKINYRIIRAKVRLKAELVDMAIDTAMEKIAAHVTDADNQKLLDTFLARVRQ